MLKSLLIKNYALIDDISIEFKSGFTAITGETGAGKSILLGALSLLLGKRADFGVIRDESKKCVVEGTFDLSQIHLAEYFVEHDLDFEIVTLIRREVISSGRSRAFINDTPVNLDTLKVFGELLFDIHSQHQTLDIGKSDFQMQVLDGFINKSELFSKYRQEYSSLIELQNKLSDLVRENEQSKREESYYRFQFEELDAANLVEGEDGLLKSREKLLIHAEEVIQGINNSIQLLSDGEEPVLSQLNEIQQNFFKIKKYHPDFEGFLERIQSVSIELEDISAEIAKMDLQTDFNPDDLSRISLRLNELYKLQQKHHVNNVAALLELQQEYKEKLTNLDQSDVHIRQLEMQVDEVSKNAERYAAQIHELRVVESPKIALSVKSVLRKLGMKEADFKVNIQKEKQLNRYGIDSVTFLFNANTGGQLKEISNVASGGELSRLMLAVKAQITREQLLPTIIFDEIDAGVSGEIAAKVGNIIKEMSKHHQIIAITHLPQIAAKADEHFKVFKTVENDTTKTIIESLPQQSRVEEIAKLLSDEKITNAALDTARELLKL